MSAPSAAPQACAHEPQPATAYTSTGLVADLRRPLDYPAEAVCGHCGEPIRRERHEAANPGTGWQLKYPENAAASREVPGGGEPEQPRALRLAWSAGSSVHVPEPKPGSFRTADGHRTVLSGARYPVWAVCRACQRQIRADGYLLPFEHDDHETAGEDADEPAQAPGPAPDGRGQVPRRCRQRHVSGARPAPDPGQGQGSSDDGS